MNALSAKVYYKHRKIILPLILAVLFGPVALVLAYEGFPVEGWIIGAIGFVIYWCLENYVMGFNCPHCRARVSPKTPWNCGFCEHKNYNANQFSLVHCCQQCGTEPKAYLCHHCKRLIFLSADQQKEGYATCITTKPAAPTEGVEAVNRQKEKEALIHQIEMAELAAKLEEKRQRSEFTKKKTPVEEIEESFTKHYSRVMGSHEFARRQRKEADERFKDDPEMRQRANESIDAWLRNRT